MSDDYTRPDGDLDERERASVVDQVDDILGQTIDGRYEVISRLGQGGMGFVWEARDLVMGGKPVVLKTLRPELVNNEKTAERFSREAMASAAIDHENVIVVLGHGVTKSYGAYYVMERLMGHDLAAAIAKHGGPLPVPRTLEIAIQVASALGAAHERGIIHRDLKPENVFLAERDGGEVVKVLDFGLARLLEAGNKLTETGAVIGTPRYMSPEQLEEKDVDERTDVYALGLILFELLVGALPYKSQSLNALLLEILTADHPPPHVLRETIPEALGLCVKRAIERFPADRFATVADFARALEPFGDARFQAPRQVHLTPDEGLGLTPRIDGERISSSIRARPSASSSGKKTKDASPAAKKKDRSDDAFAPTAALRADAASSPEAALDDEAPRAAWLIPAAAIAVVLAVGGGLAGMYLRGSDEAPATTTPAATIAEPAAVAEPAPPAEPAAEPTPPPEPVAAPADPPPAAATAPEPAADDPVEPHAARPRGRRSAAAAPEAAAPLPTPAPTTSQEDLRVNSRAGVLRAGDF